MYMFNSQPIKWHRYFQTLSLKFWIGSNTEAEDSGELFSLTAEQRSHEYGEALSYKHQYAPFICVYRSLPGLVSAMYWSLEIRWAHSST